MPASRGVADRGDFGQNLVAPVKDVRETIASALPVNIELALLLALAVAIISRTLVDTRTGAPLPAAEIDARMRGVGVLEPGERRTVFYCGGGVSAAWNALALSAVGGPDAAVYDGSMPEWAADPDLPLVLGPES